VAFVLIAVVIFLLMHLEIYSAYVAAIIFAVLTLVALLLLLHGKIDRAEKADKIKLGDRHLRLLTEGFHTLVSCENEREALQKVIENAAFVGDFSFIGLIEFESGENRLGMPAYFCADESCHEIILATFGDNPRNLTFPFKPQHPIIQSLSSGDTVSVDSSEQLAVVSELFGNIANSIIEDGTDVKRLKIYPLRTREELVGAFICKNAGKENCKSELMEPFLDQGTQVLRIIKILRQLRDANALYSDIIQNVDYGIYMVDNKLRLLSFNRALAEFFDLSANDVGKSLGEAIPFIKRLDYSEIYADIFQTGKSKVFEETTYLKNAQKRYARIKLVPIFSSKGRVRRVMSIIEDITEQKELSEELRETVKELRIRAETDGLTGLNNYRYFSETLPKAIELAHKANAPLSLIVLDLDNLKEYNDLGGHHYGDNLLKVVAQLLMEHESPGDTTARYGGDEFVMILRNTDLESARRRAELIRANIVDYPFADEERLPTGNITASFGVAELTKEINDADNLMRRADRAMYRAKEEGKNRVCVWKKKAPVEGVNV